MLKLGLSGVRLKRFGFGPELSPLRMFSGPVQKFQCAIFEAWKLKVSTSLSEREGFRDAQFWDVRGSHELSRKSC